MLRRIVLFVVAGIIAAQPLCGAEKTNLVLFLADDLGQIECSPYASKEGPTPARTPNMLRLAEAGMTFTQAFVASPSCAPNRATLLTGLHIARHGAVNNHDKPQAGIKKWPAYFHELGYEVMRRFAPLIAQRLEATSIQLLDLYGTHA